MASIITDPTTTLAVTDLPLADPTATEIQELLTIRNPDTHPDANPSLPSHQIQYFDDRHHPDYEWIRIPRRRAFDMFAVPLVPPEDRNHAQVPLTAIRESDGVPVTMWAKMDTGADANTIARTTLERLLGAALDTRLTPVPEDVDFGVLGAHAVHVRPRHTVRLTFTAGAARRRFEDVLFYVVDDDASTTDTDGLSNILLGYDTLRQHSMVMIDLEYHTDAEPGLDVLCERVEVERPGSEEILDLQFLPRVKGLSPEPRRVTHGGILLPGSNGPHPGLVRVRR